MEGVNVVGEGDVSVRGILEGGREFSASSGNSFCGLHS